MDVKTNRNKFMQKIEKFLDNLKTFYERTPVTMVSTHLKFLAEFGNGLFVLTIA